MVKVTIAHFARILTVTLLLIYEGILTPTLSEISAYHSAGPALGPLRIYFNSETRFFTRVTR